VGRGETRTDLPRDLRGSLRRKTPDAAYDGGKILAVHVFHRQKECSLRFANVENAANVGMRDLACGADLGVKPCERGRILGERLGKKFDGHNLT